MQTATICFNSSMKYLFVSAASEIIDQHFYHGSESCWHFNIYRHDEYNTPVSKTPENFKAKKTHIIFNFF